MKYPMHEKIKAREDEHQAVSEFCEWLDGHYEIAKIKKSDCFIPAYETFKTSKVIAEYFEINEKELKREKRHVLAFLG